MELLKGILESKTRLRVVSTYNMNIEENANMDTNDGVLVEASLPFPELKRGTQHIHYVNPQTGEQWYEEQERPFTQEELLEIQSEKIDLLLQMQMATQGII